MNIGKTYKFIEIDWYMSSPNHISSCIPCTKDIYGKLVVLNSFRLSYQKLIHIFIRVELLFKVIVAVKPYIGIAHMHMGLLTSCDRRPKV